MSTSPVANTAPARASDNAPSAREAPHRIPRDAARFPIERVTDSTASFRLEEARWIRTGLPAWVVDGARGDALVARLRVTRRDSLSATALVLSQAAVVRPTHVLLVARPTPPWWKRGVFWSGAALGAAVGLGGASLSR
ncbi:MAG: hypothetical protein LCH84_11735 [Gemmatimonadetes bacterium]|nr:hypothetical protein [Gemmatimonadota bacterium]